MLVQRYAILVVLIQPGSRILCNMLGKCDCGEYLEIVMMYGLKVMTEILEERLGIFSVPIHDKLDEGVHKHWP